jgi:Lipoprotein confined to pathogenic Mycobacterium
MTHRRLPRLLPGIAALLALSAGCAQPETPIVNKDVPTMDITTLPTIAETQRQMLALIDSVQAEISRAVPATRPWRWHRAWLSSGCLVEGQDGGASLFFPKLTSDTALSDEQWQQVFPVIKELAADAGLTNVSAPQNATGNHDARFNSNDGRELSLGSRKSTVLSATISCRLSGEDLRGPDGRIPLPPDPQS